MSVIFYAEKEATMGPDDDLLSPGQAARYLQEKWGRPFTAKDLNNLRANAKKQAARTNRPVEEFFPIEPALLDNRITGWRRADLDLLAERVPAPRLRQEIRGVGKRGKRNNT